MRTGKDPKVLVAVAGTTRAWELCWDGFASHVLDELGADLALCTGDRDPRPIPFYERAKYTWSFEQPDDWADVYDRVVGDPSWRALLRPGDHLLGGVRSTEHPQPGVGALVIYMRWLLKQSLVRSRLIAEYDWLILTRSDFLWELPHPRLRHLSERRVYTFDGEHYGGISLRHLIAPRRHAERLLSLYDPVFTEPERLRRRLDRRCTVEGWYFMNLEEFHAARLKELGSGDGSGSCPTSPTRCAPPADSPDGALGSSTIGSASTSSTRPSGSARRSPAGSSAIGIHGAATLHRSAAPRRAGGCDAHTADGGCMSAPSPFARRRSAPTG